MTRSMTRWALAGLMALAALGVVSAPVQADPQANPFAGSWSGTWSHVGEDVVGTWTDWTISDAGRITGTFYSLTNSFGGTIEGHVRADGILMFVGNAPSDTPSEDHGAYPLEGRAVIDGDGHLVVSVTGTWSGAFSLVGILARD